LKLGVSNGISLNVLRLQSDRGELKLSPAAALAAALAGFNRTGGN